jgi:hypothetical protein
VGDDPAESVAERLHLETLSRRDGGHVGGVHRQQHDAFMDDAVVLEVVQQRVRRTHRIARLEDGGPGHSHHLLLLEIHEELLEGQRRLAQAPAQHAATVAQRADRNFELRFPRRRYSAF